MVTLPAAVAAILALVPYLIPAFGLRSSLRAIQSLSRWARVLVPSLFCLPYLLVSLSAGIFRWSWLAIYGILPVAMAALMQWACQDDPEQRGHWREWCILIPLGLSVDLRWFEAAWPPHLGGFNKVLLLDGGIYAVMLTRQLDGVGLDLRLRFRDLGIGLREFLSYTPIALVLGLSLGFLHWHAIWPSAVQAAEALLFTFFFIAVPEELFFRGWIQNLLQNLLGKRFGRTPALVAAAIIFGLSHWNKRTTSFNWQYVLLAAIAGVFYGRAWRHDRRVAASAVAHTLVDTVWSLWLR